MKKMSKKKGLKILFSTLAVGATAIVSVASVVSCSAWYPQPNRPTTPHNIAYVPPYTTDWATEPTLNIWVNGQYIPWTPKRPKVQPTGIIYEPSQQEWNDVGNGPQLNNVPYGATIVMSIANYNSTVNYSDGGSYTWSYGYNAQNSISSYLPWHSSYDYSKYNNYKDSTGYTTEWATNGIPTSLAVQTGKIQEPISFNMNAGNPGPAQNVLANVCCSANGKTMVISNVALPSGDNQLPLIGVSQNTQPYSEPGNQEWDSFTYTVQITMLNPSTSSSNQQTAAIQKTKSSDLISSNSVNKNLQNDYEKIKANVIKTY